MNSRFFSILGIGILLSPLFPTGGSGTLITKVLERILFNIADKPIMMASISGVVGLILSIIVFKYSLNYFAKFEYNGQSEISKAFRIAAQIFVGYQLIWMIIPFVDGRLGSRYNQNLNSSYHAINQIINYDIFISAPFWIVGNIIGIWIIYNTINSMENKR